MKIHIFKHYFTRSARLRECNGWLARAATSSSAIVAVLGGCDHLWADGEGCLAELAERVQDFKNNICVVILLLERSGLAKAFMVALDMAEFEMFRFAEATRVYEHVVTGTYWKIEFHIWAGNLILLSFGMHIEASQITARRTTLSLYHSFIHLF